MKPRFEIATSLFILFLPFCWAQLAVGSIYRLITIGLMCYTFFNLYYLLFYYNVLE